VLYFGKYWNSPIFGYNRNSGFTPVKFFYFKKEQIENKQTFKLDCISIGNFHQMKLTTVTGHMKRNRLTWQPHEHYNTLSPTSFSHSCHLWLKLKNRSLNLRFSMKSFRVRNQTVWIINLMVCSNQPPISLTNNQLSQEELLIICFIEKYALNFDLNCIEGSLYFVSIKLCKRKKLVISSGESKRGKVLKKEKSHDPYPPILSLPLTPHPPKFKLFSILERKGGNRKRAQLLSPSKSAPEISFPQKCLACWPRKKRSSADGVDVKIVKIFLIS